MTNTLNIAIAGLGTVGVGTFNILTQKQSLLQKRSNTTFNITAVSAKNKNKDRGIDINSIHWEDNPVALADRDDVDIVLELIGGDSGTAYDLCKKALENGKHVVTANKALIAHHGLELATIAERQNVKLAFEAAVAGAIPILKGLREGLSANEFKHITGILNGTGNYILTEMEATGNDFTDILKEAQEKGYAEADPSFDIDGIDSAHKLAIIASIAYGTKINFDQVHIEGIRNITIKDIKNAHELGYKIKLLGTCRLTDQGLEQRVTPCMIDKNYPLAKVDGVFNAILAQCDQAGKSIFEGRGAGEKPTASSVVADIIDIATQRAPHPFNMPVESLTEPKTRPIEELTSAYYIRLSVIDEPGVIANITRILTENNISMKSLLQNNSNPTQYVQVVLTTHPTKEKLMTNALTAINALDSVVETPHMIRIVDL